MKLVPLTIACPQCSSPDVLYSCKPECCFNHVCGKCYTTFELATSKVGELASELGPLPPEPDSTAPTAPCARCGECKLFAIEENGEAAGRLVCVDCRALLTLEVTEVTPGGNQGAANKQ